MRNLAIAIGQAAVLCFFTTPSLPTAQAKFGTEKEARAMLTAHPYLKGEHVQDIVGKKGYPLGKEIMEHATEGKINEVTYFWPRPGSDTPVEKHSFYTKVAGQNCGVGYYKG